MACYPGGDHFFGPPIRPQEMGMCPPLSPLPGYVPPPNCNKNPFFPQMLERSFSCMPSGPMLPPQPAPSSNQMPYLPMDAMFGNFPPPCFERLQPMAFGGNNSEFMPNVKTFDGGTYIIEQSMPVIMNQIIPPQGFSENLRFNMSTPPTPNFPLPNFGKQMQFNSGWQRFPPTVTFSGAKNTFTSFNESRPNPDMPSSSTGTTLRDSNPPVLEKFLDEIPEILSELKQQAESVSQASSSENSMGDDSIAALVKELGLDQLKDLPDLIDLDFASNSSN